MALNGPERSFTDDSRGVSGVVGFILIFAILMILLSINQAQVVPQENREIEFQHFQDVRNDMVEVRSGISTAGQVNVSQYPTVNLGTNYPTRILAVNPPPPTGTLETSPEYNISIRNQTGATPQNVSTHFLEYRNGYHQMDIGSIWYEHSVLYLDERNNTGEIAVIEDQNIIRSSDSVRVNALQNDYRESSTGRVTIELYPTKRSDEIFGDLSGEIIVEIPTRLNHSEYWEDNMGNFEAYNGVEQDAVEEGVHILNLTVDADSLQFGTVGIDSAPEGEKSPSQGVGLGGGGGNNNEQPDPGDTIVSVSGSAGQQGSSGKYDFSLKNSGSVNVTLVGIGINGTDDPNADEVEKELKVDDNDNGNPKTEIIDGPITFDSNTPSQAERDDFNSPVELGAGVETKFTFDKFDSNDVTNVIITLWFETEAGNKGSTTISLVEDLYVSEINADGSPPKNEYISLTNERGGSSIDMGGWTVSDSADDNTYSIPSGFSLGPGETVTIHSGVGTDNSSDLYWGGGDYVWNNGGDTIHVENDTGETIIEYGYSG